MDEALSNSHSNVVTQLAEALRYKREGRGFDCRWEHSELSLT